MVDLTERLQTALGASYRLEKELGGGGMSRVFVAQETALGRRVVIKLLPPEMAAGVSIERFRREIQLAASLQHPHIVPLLSAGSSGDLLYYVMPFIEGASLRTKLAREHELPIPEAIRILRDVSAALAYAHAHGVVHRDIKPDNVLISGQFAVVTDFGVAKALSESTGASSITSLGVALGTPSYMSPEQAAADPHTDHRADIYSLGAMAYEMLTGRPPFLGTSPQMVLTAHVTKVPDPVTEHRHAVPPVLAAMVMRCLEKKAADRWQSAEELYAQLEAMATPSGGMTPTASVPAAATAATLTATRRLPRHALSIAAGLLIVAIVGAGGRFLYNRRAPLDPKRVSVAAFTNKTGEPRFDPVGAMASDIITRGLTGTGAVEIVPSGAGTQVRGSFFRQDDSLVFSAEMIDLSTGKLLRAIGPESAPALAPQSGIARLHSRVMSGVAMMLEQSYGTQGIVTGQPPRYDAYREYIGGEEAFYRAAYDSAIARFRRAAALDPTFRFPLLRVAVAYLNADRYAPAESTVSVLSSRRGELSPFESAYLDEIGALGRRDYRAAHAAAQEMSRTAPKSDFVTFLIAVSAHQAGFWQEAVATFQRLDPESGMLRGRLFYFENLTSSLHMLGEHKRELEVAERGRRLYPDRLRMRLPEVRALAALGRVDEVNARISESLSLPAGEGLTPADVMWTAIAELRAHGHPEAARSVNEQLLAWISTRPVSEAKSEGTRAYRAMALYFAGRWDNAGGTFDSLATEHPDSMVYLGWRGRVAARRGNRAGAEQISQQLAALSQPNLFGRPTLARARIAAILGSKDQAVQLLQDAIAHGAIVANYENDIDFTDLRDYPPFKELFRPKG